MHLKIDHSHEHEMLVSYIEHRKGECNMPMHGMKKKKGMARGGAMMKKKKSYARGGAARRR